MCFRLPRRRAEASTIMRVMREERGETLIEVVIAIGVIGIVMVGFLGALRGGMMTLISTDERQTAVSLAQSQMENVRMQPFLTSYTPAPVPAEYAGYSVAISADSINTRDVNMQNVKITVSHQGRAIIMAPGCTLESFRVNH
jgi:type II secretory pathway pseudopilin PulG